MSEPSKITTSVLKQMKKRSKRIIMLTAYDYPMAKVLDGSGIDIILLGDSMGNVVLGYENTLPVTMDEMLSHAKAVKRAVKKAMFVVDMPFMSYQTGLKDALQNAARFVKEAGAEGVKMEGDKYIGAIEAIVDAGIPVMGHIGFTPQLVNEIGGYKVAGKDKAAAAKILAQAKRLERAGVFALVLEMVPALLAKRITKAVKVPVIGIGAGPNCDGQVLVTHDMLGLNPGHTPKFAKQYVNLGKLMKEAVSTFMWDVHTGSFPGKEQSF